MKGTPSHAPHKLVRPAAGGDVRRLVEHRSEGTNPAVNGLDSLKGGFEHLDGTRLAGSIEFGESARPQLPKLSHRLRGIVGTAL